MGVGVGVGVGAGAVEQGATGEGIEKEQTGATQPGGRKAFKHGGASGAISANMLRYKPLIGIRGKPSATRGNDRNWHSNSIIFIQRHGIRKRAGAFR